MLQQPKRLKILFLLFSLLSFSQFSVVTSAQPTYEFSIEHVSSVDLDIPIWSNFYEWSFAPEKELLFIKSKLGFAIVDVSNPVEPVFITDVPLADLDFFIVDMAYHDDLLFFKVAASSVDNTLYIYNVSNPLAVSFAGWLSGSSLYGSNGLTFLGNDLLVNEGKYCFALVNYSNLADIQVTSWLSYSDFDEDPFGPSQPRSLGVVPHPSLSLFLISFYGFNQFPSSTNPIFMFDYSDPANLEQKTYLYPDEDIFHYYGASSFLYENNFFPLADYGNTKYLLDWTSPYNISIIDSYHCSGELQSSRFSVDTNSSRLFFYRYLEYIGGGSLLVSIDLATPFTLLSEPLDLADSVYSICQPFFSGDYIFCYDAIYDYEPTSPVSVWQIVKNQELNNRLAYIITFSVLGGSIIVAAVIFLVKKFKN
ncbi:MAG: hypothetical protein ACTSQX_16015 [Candidatus Heimdallarchaeota archaeon]